MTHLKTKVGVALHSTGITRLSAGLEMNTALRDSYLVMYTTQWCLGI